MQIQRLKEAAPIGGAGTAEVAPSVADIIFGVIKAVRERGDEAVSEYGVKFDGVKPRRLQVSWPPRSSTNRS